MPDVCDQRNGLCQGFGVRLSAQSDELPCMTDPVRLEEACRSLLGEPQRLKLACGQWIPRRHGALRHRFRSVRVSRVGSSARWSIGNRTTEGSSAVVRNARAVAGRALPGARCPPCTVTGQGPPGQSAREETLTCSADPDPPSSRRSERGQIPQPGVVDGTLSTSQTCQVSTTFDRPTRSTQNRCHV